ncbi:hypothetical protein PR048_000210 [Dryococelus australis]|uniref:Uncharacterized protein n=1 Tax=Dryococelus australis TaxID=614101 RepID=A0ABQ9IE02_9NEOP|nr:hypothetical protein PR048_000210 [Dryococelus australis]
MKNIIITECARIQCDVLRCNFPDLVKLCLPMAEEYPRRRILAGLQKSVKCLFIGCCPREWPALPHTLQCGIGYVFPCKSAIGSEASRTCIIYCVPIAKVSIDSSRQDQSIARIKTFVWRGYSEIACVYFKKLTKLNTILSYTRQKAKSKYRNRTWLERAFQKQSSDTHKAPCDWVKRCCEFKRNIQLSERSNVDVFTQKKNKRPFDIDEIRICTTPSPELFVGRFKRTAIFSEQNKHWHCGVAKQLLNVHKRSVIANEKYNEGNIQQRQLIWLENTPEKSEVVPLIGGFSRGPPVSPPFHSGAAPYPLQSPSSALKNSMTDAEGASRNIHVTQNYTAGTAKSLQARRLAALVSPSRVRESSYGSAACGDIYKKN